MDHLTLNQMGRKKQQPKIATYNVFASVLDNRTGRLAVKNLTTIQARGVEEAQRIGSKYSKMMSAELHHVSESWEKCG